MKIRNFIMAGFLGLAMTCFMACNNNAEQAADTTAPETTEVEGCCEHHECCEGQEGECCNHEGECCNKEGECCKGQEGCNHECNHEGECCNK